MTALQIVHGLSALIVLAEALNKLERTVPCAPGLTSRQRLVSGLKSISWSLLALGAGGGLATPVLLSMGVGPEDYGVLMQLDPPSLSETVVMLGSALLIVRTRVKNG